ncbi:hypothetical protein BD413DRAFT_578997 [Trametes elegans]|nr:hypothetical protein BD413DRAFT_578997 [Trametes elegans]
MLLCTGLSALIRRQMPERVVMCTMVSTRAVRPAVRLHWWFASGRHARPFRTWRTTELPGAQTVQTLGKNRRRIRTTGSRTKLHQHSQICVFPPRPSEAQTIWSIAHTLGYGSRKLSTSAPSCQRRTIAHPFLSQAFERLGVSALGLKCTLA